MTSAIRGRPLRVGARILRRMEGIRRIFTGALPCLSLLAVPGRGMGMIVQGQAAMAPLPAEPPIGGFVWTVLIPAILLLGSFVGTYLLYRRFSRVEAK